MISLNFSKRILKTCLYLPALLLPFAACNELPKDAYVTDKAPTSGKPVAGSAASTEDSNSLLKAGTRANSAGDFASARQLMESALKKQRETLGNENPAMFGTLLSLAMVNINDNNLRRADVLLIQAEKLADKSPDPNRKARVLHYRGAYLLASGDNQKALATLTRSEAEYKSNISHDALDAKAPPALNPFGRGAAAKIGNSGPAVNLAANPAQQSAILGLVELLRLKANAQDALNQTDAAAKTLTELNDLTRGNGLDRPIVVAPIFRSMAVNSVAADKPEAAIKRFGQAARNYKRAMPGSRAQAENDLQLAGMLQDYGETLEAVYYCRTAIDSLVKLTITTSPDMIAPCLRAFRQIAGTTQVPNQAVLAEMFEAAQLGQSSIVNEQVAQAIENLAENARDPKVGALYKRRRDLDRQLSALYERRDALDAKAERGGDTAKFREETAAVEQAIIDANNQLTDVNTQLRIASPNSQQLLPQSAKADAVIKSLAPGETFVMPVLSSAEGWTFVVRDGKITVYPIAKGQGAIGEYVSKIRRSIMPANDASSPPPFDVASSRELYDTVFAEAGKDMSGSSSVVVAPNGPLLSVPLEILLTGPTDAANLAGAPWLFRQYKVTHVPSANNFVGLRRVAPNSQASKAWFGFGGFQPSTIVQANAKFPAAQCGGDARAFAGLDPLQGARKELQAAKALYAGAAGSGGIGELVGPEFTSEQVLRAPLKDYQVLHFAAHGLLPTDLVCQTEAAIVTSPLPGAKDAGGALLNASQIATLDLDANLVILSACNSGGPGGKAEGEALTGLALSFFSAGARSLLVTHWSVNDRVTAYLVANLVQKMNTKRAEGVTGALREVALEMLDKAGKDLPAEIQHPFYWAPFAVIGDGLERVSAQPLRTASR